MTNIPVPEESMDENREEVRPAGAEEQETAAALGCCTVTSSQGDGRAQTTQKRCREWAKEMNGEWHWVPGPC